MVFREAQRKQNHRKTKHSREMKYIKNAVIFFSKLGEYMEAKGSEGGKKNKKNRRQRWYQILAGSQCIRKILQIGNTV